MGTIFRKKAADFSYLFLGGISLVFSILFVAVVSFAVRSSVREAYAQAVPPAWRLAIRERDAAGNYVGFIGYITNEDDEPFVAFVPSNRRGTTFYSNYPVHPSHPNYNIPPRPGAMGVGTFPGIRERFAVDPVRVLGQPPSPPGYGPSNGVRIGSGLHENDGTMALLVTSDDVGDQKAVTIRAGVTSEQVRLNTNIFSVEGSDSDCAPGRNCEQWLTVRANGNVGVGIEKANTKLQVHNGDIYVSNPNAAANKGLILQATPGVCYRITVDPSGNLGTERVNPCP